MFPNCEEGIPQGIIIPSMKMNLDNDSAQGKATYTLFIAALTNSHLISNID